MERIRVSQKGKLGVAFLVLSDLVLELLRQGGFGDVNGRLVDDGPDLARRVDDVGEQRGGRLFAGRRGGSGSGSGSHGGRLLVPVDGRREGERHDEGRMNKARRGEERRRRSVALSS